VFFAHIFRNSLLYNPIIYIFAFQGKIDDDDKDNVTMVILLHLLFAVRYLVMLVALHCYFVPALTALHVLADCCTDSEDSREESGGEDNSVGHHYQNNGLS
jgi:hypothetical protein